MKYSGLYFIPAPTNAPEASTTVLNALINNIESKFDDAARQNPWGLVHRLLRSVVSPSAPPSQQTPNLQHVLQLSYLSTSRTYCYIHPSPPTTQVAASVQVKNEPTSQAPTPLPQPAQSSTTAGAEKGTIISIPVAQSDAHMALLVNQLSSLWAFRHAMSLQNGITYNIGQFIINLGELKASRQGTTSMSNASTAGVAVCISTVADSEEDQLDDSGYASLNGDADAEVEVDVSASQTAVRSLWDALKTGIEFGKTEPREYFMAPEVLKGEKQREAVVRMWCELLRMRG
ncbi:mediator complex, subunit Med20 [Lophiotrema nucula]|uniref:Mediator of RNA polymerase II transcription subunit 20 n=1 Tax=Lophiotrema nucula TaxID=690887 RepID=A0A6A5YZM2_9PLEO|nr:mediator complex, subunit Med20 [Lophiotrema nucula]